MSNQHVMNIYPWIINMYVLVLFLSRASIILCYVRLLLFLFDKDICEVFLYPLFVIHCLAQYLESKWFLVPYSLFDRNKQSKLYSLSARLIDHHGLLFFWNHFVRPLLKTNKAWHLWKRNKDVCIVDEYVHNESNTISKIDIWTVRQLPVKRSLWFISTSLVNRITSMIILLFFP